MLATRLGASLTVALPFMVAVLAIPTLFGPNLQVIDGLKPSFSLPESFALPPFSDKTNTFQKLWLTMNTQAFLSGLEKGGNTFACNDKEKGILLVDDSSSNLQCAKTFESSLVSETRGMIMCNLTIECDVTGSFSGTQDVTLKFPSSFQTIAWNATTSVWDNKRTSLAQVVSPSDDNILSGNEKSPSVLRFGALRSKKIDKRDLEKIIPDEYGVQLDWVGTQREESIGGSSDTHHYIAFEFSVGDSVYVTESSQKLTMLTRFSTVLTLLLSVMSAMRFFKIYLEVGIDTCLVKNAKRNGQNPPDDVLRRVRVLDEHAITGSGQGIRRLSSSAAMLQNINIDGNDGNDGSSITIEMANLAGTIRRSSRNSDEGEGDDELSEATNSLVNRLQRQVLVSNQKIAILEDTLERLMKHVSYIPGATAMSIKDEVPTKMVRNPHWKKLKQSVSIANKFRSISKATSASSPANSDNFKGRKNRTKRLSTVIKARRNSATTVEAGEMKVSPSPPSKSL